MKVLLDTNVLVAALVARGTGTETLTSTHMAVEATFDAVLVGRDTVSCRFQM